MATTSINAYYSTSESRHSIRSMVLEAINSFSYPVCDSQIAEYLDLPINVVTGRRNELAKAGLVVERFKAKSPFSSVKVKYWGGSE